MPSPRSPGAPEELSWDSPVELHGESRAARDSGVGGGFLLRLHADPHCPARLVAEADLLPRRYDAARAESLCPDCTGALVASSASTVVRRLHEAERTLLGLRARSGEGPMPREIVHCRALRFEAQSAVSVHPDAALLAVRVAALATNVAQTLHEAMAAYDRARLSQRVR